MSSLTDQEFEHYLEGIKGIREVEYIEEFDSLELDPRTCSCKGCSLAWKESYNNACYEKGLNGSINAGIIEGYPWVFEQSKRDRREVVYIHTGKGWLNNRDHNRSLKVYKELYEKIKSIEPRIP